MRDADTTVAQHAAGLGGAIIDATGSRRDSFITHHHPVPVPYLIHAQRRRLGIHERKGNFCYLLGKAILPSTTSAPRPSFLK